MQVFQFRGFPGLLLLLMMIFLAITLLVLLPSFLLTALWNATVFEFFHGPEIAFYQGGILWLMLSVLLHLALAPQIQFRMGSSPEDFEDLSALSGRQDKPSDLDRSALPPHWHQWRKKIDPKSKNDRDV